MFVNGSPIEEFTDGCGLRQRDSLALFLFLIIVEGLTRLFQKAVQIGEYSRYQVEGGLKFDILQFKDDTILFWEAIAKKLWNIKTILRRFELVFGLHINFYKSNLYGINIKEMLMWVLHHCSYIFVSNFYL